MCVFSILRFVFVVHQHPCAWSHLRFLKAGSRVCEHLPTALIVGPEQTGKIPNLISNLREFVCISFLSSYLSFDYKVSVPVTETFFTKNIFLLLLLLDKILSKHLLL